MNNDYEIKNKDNITGKMELKLDKDFNILMNASQKTGIPVTFMGDRIVDFKINNFPEFSSFKPDKIVIGPTATLFDLKLGDDSFNNIPFDKLKISENIILFKTSVYAKFDAILKIRLKLKDLDERKVNINISLIPKSNKIEDILNYELFKKKYNGSKLQIKVSDLEELLFDGNLPKVEIYEDYINFINKIDKINKKLNLDIHLNDDYVITNKDEDTSNFLCEFINYRRVKINELKIDLNLSYSKLEEILNNKQQFLLEQNHYAINLLGNNIDLGSCKISVKDYEILNKSELIDILNLNKYNGEEFKVQLLIKSLNDELYLNFN